MVGFVRRLLTLAFVPARWRIACFCALGALFGLGLAVAQFSRAASYLSDDPEACINCHVMNPHYATWQHSSHFRVAHCNDCHVPHDNFASTYLFKAQDGARHATMFTLRLEPQVIRLSKGAIPVVENNCRRCHANVIDGVHSREHQPGDPRCWDCHREVPHGRVRSLSATPFDMRPQLPDAGQWTQEPTIGGRRPR